MFSGPSAMTSEPSAARRAARSAFGDPHVGVEASQRGVRVGVGHRARQVGQALAQIERGGRALPASEDEQATHVEIGKRGRLTVCGTAPIPKLPRAP